MTLTDEQPEAPVPNPGSKEAQALGCICAVLDNARGRGARIDEHGKPQFWITVGCPLHSPPQEGA